MSESILTLSDVSAGYGRFPVLHGLGLEVSYGDIACVIGPNGAGKTTLLRTISGLLPAWSGSILFRSQEIGRLSAERIVTRGLAHVPQERHIFPDMTVRENLSIGATPLRHTAKPRRHFADAIDQWMERFPILRKRADQPAGVLSGGEQQILAICRALMSEPVLLLMDEPSLGLSPAATDLCFEIIRDLKRQGVTVLLVEQNRAKVDQTADKVFVMEFGDIRSTEGL